MPDTKEKPYQCHCGAAFTRRDLLTRHRRITTHENIPKECVENSRVQSDQDGANSDIDTTSVTAAAAAAASLSTMSMHPWSQQRESIFEPIDAVTEQLQQPPVLHHEPLGHG
jgi:uncharacterized Zn-finger protein